MIVKDLVETTELMLDEVGENVAVIYELFDNADCHCDGEKVEEIECDPEEVVQILAGCSVDSLTNIKTYQVGKDFSSVEEVINDIRKNYKHLLK
ncbi:hypothetical protein [Evansella tamaricis]|uniref:Uncharacterized protein n=1 Tax=Evansella tamaricis TaxID=2069301 RepID=A0ABS6JMH8_9BACI|nr:hypothetical protein [Evansella tamaricis]MBU9714738.1 hypothetical protein [Evansella tamaricis]